MNIYPISDPYAVHYTAFAGDVYTLATAGITLTAGSFSAGGDITAAGAGIFDYVTIADDGDIGSVSYPTAITIRASGNVYLLEDLGVTGKITCDELTLTAPSANAYKFTNYSTYRLALDAQGSGQHFILDYFTEDGDATKAVYTIYWAKGTLGSPDINERLIIGYDATNFIVNTNATGVGAAVKPLILYTGANTNQLYLDTDGQAGIGKVPVAELDVDGSILIADAGNIGSLSDPDAIAIAADGKTTFTQDLTVNEDIVIGDAKYIGSTSDPDAIQIEADGDVVLTQDLAVAGNVTIDGVLNLTGNAAYADYRTLSMDNELAIQSQEANTAAEVGLYPKNGDGGDDVSLTWWGKATPESHTDAERMIVRFDAGERDFRFFTHASGTGTRLPIIFHTTATFSNQLYLDTDGQVGIGTATPATALDVTGTVTATALAAPTKGTATMVVAPSTASALVKAKADYVCDGTADEVQINAAIVAAAAEGGRTSGTVGVGGSVHLLAGSYVLAAPIVMLTRVDLIGQGNLQSVRISNGDNCGNGIYFKAWDAAASPIGVDERGQFKIANMVINLSYTQSGTSWCVYMDNDGTEHIYDCIFENVYCGTSRTGGMYVLQEWASHYDNCTFEHSEGPGYQVAESSGAVHVGSYFAYNNGHGCHIEASSYTRLLGCGFDYNGNAIAAADNTVNNDSSGLYINSASAKNITVTDCSATKNYHTGFYLNAGIRVHFDNCVASMNNYAESTSRGGFRLNANASAGCSLVNCHSLSNDGVTPATPPDNGIGYMLSTVDATLINCISSGNKYGVYFASSGTPTGNVIDVIDGGNHVTFFLVYNSDFKDAIKNAFGKVRTDRFQDVAALDTDGVHAAITQTASAQNITTGITNPAVPRNVTVSGDANAEGIVLIRGIAANGMESGTIASESITISAGATVQGVIAWATVTKITIPIDTSIPTAGIVTIGWGDKLGLSVPIRATTDIFKITINGADDALTDYTINATYGTVLPTAAINANDDFVIYYRGL